MNHKPSTQDVLDLVEGLSGVVAELEGRITVLEQALIEIREEANREHPERAWVGHIARVAHVALVRE